MGRFRRRCQHASPSPPLSYQSTAEPHAASNRRGGPEGVIDAVEQLAPQGFSDIDSVLSYEQREAIVRGYAAKAGFAARVVARS